MVSSVVISNDGGDIVSRSRDCTLRIWKREKGKCVGVPLRGHTGWVSSVAISDVGEDNVSDLMITHCGSGSARRENM